jgi:NAD(P)-dependent dehydrogenase (short-subunit alcohol dehydrogenase family)
VDVDARALAATAATHGSAAFSIRADVTDEAAMRAAVAAAVDRFGRLDVVVANAGSEILGPVASMASDDVVRLIDVDLVEVWTTIRVALAEIPRARGARRLSARRLPGDSRTPNALPLRPRDRSSRRRRRRARWGPRQGARDVPVASQATAARRTRRRSRLDVQRRRDGGHRGRGAPRCSRDPFTDAQLSPVAGR